MEILIPHGLPTQLPIFQQMQRAALPALTAFVSHATSDNAPLVFPPHARSLPHNAWLAHRFGLTANQNAENSPPVACALMSRYGLTPDDGFWFVVTPMHLEVGMSQMALTNPAHLMLNDADARPLFEAAKTLFDETGLELRYGDAGTWFVRADHWQALRTAMPESAIGRDVSNWLPDGEARLTWHQLQNEIQMHWHAHPANRQRAKRGEAAVNSLWLWGGAFTTTGEQTIATPFTNTYQLDGWTRAFHSFSLENAIDCTAAEIIASPPENGLLLLSEFSEPALSNDWETWANTWQALDKAWLVPLIDAIKNRQFDRLMLHLSHDTRLISFVLNRTSLRKFWIRNKLDALRP